MSGKTYFLIFLGLAAVGLIAYLVINNQNAKNQNRFFHFSPEFKKKTQMTSKYRPKYDFYVIC